jgi:hypothetical protein
MNNKSIQERTFDLLESTGLNWTVAKEPLVSAVDGKISSSYGLFRKDIAGRETSDNNRHLDTVTNRYTVLQNAEVAEALIAAADEVKLNTTRGGQLLGGKHIYLQAELPNEFVGKSALKRWLTGLNTHGSKSAAFGSTNTVVICENTFYQAFGELTTYRHSASIKERIQEFVKGIRTAMGFEKDQIDLFKAMAATSLKEEIFARVISACFNVDIEAKPEDASSRQKNKLKTVADAIEIEVKAEGATLWGLFNGITRYTNHVAKADKIKTPEELTNYLMVGEGYEVNLKAYKTIHEWLIDQKIVDSIKA